MKRSCHGRVAQASKGKTRNSHYENPLDIPLERRDRPQRSPASLNVNTTSPRQLKRHSGLGEAEAESISRGCPYKQKDEPVTREIFPQGTFDKSKNLIIVEQVAS